jgi:hypothetical protein
MKTDLRSRVLKALQSDDSFDSKFNSRVVKTYTEASDEVKETVDDIFIDLCGYSLATLILGKENEV